ncbi:MAG: D-aminoacylase [Dehalococcoidia bacterium]|nr:D-aminoacylase [Dehalococcoidia bacterium]
MHAGEPAMAFDLIVRGGVLYDGNGGAPYVADIAVSGDRIARIGGLEGARAASEIDAAGMAVAPGFVNMLSHSYLTLLQDGRSLGELKQGVTLQIFGEGYSMGPQTPAMRERAQKRAREQPLPVDIAWTSLAEYLSHAESKGIAQNVASYIGATTLREYAVGQDDRPATGAELDVMCGLVRDEMSAGALGIGSSLIYPPAFFASTEELIALCDAAAPYEGKYISHMRDEGNRLLEAVDELARIGREAGVPAEIWHLKAAGKANWYKLDAVIEKVEGLRAQGEWITADMYTYTAGGTGLANIIPPWFHDGGPRKLLERLADAAMRAEIRRTIETSHDGWENLYAQSPGPDEILIVGVRKDENRQFQGKTLRAIGDALGLHPIDAAFELIRSDRSRISTVYFMMSEENVRRQLQLPWVSFGSDASSTAAEGGFLREATHPRAYGNFARLLGRYVRDEDVLSLPEAVRRLTSLPCDNLGIGERGRLAAGCYADIVVFDPATIADRATYEQPHQYAVGVRDVVVNGAVTLRDGDFAGPLAGRAVYGPGRR